MALVGEVLSMLCPQSQVTVVGNDYEGITWLDNKIGCTKAEFEAGFAQYDAWKAEQDSKVEADKAALLAKLGINADEAKLLLS
jgi:hypothetical protein